MPSVELFGQARILAGQKEVTVEANSIRDALAELASRCPSLVGPVLDGTGAPTPAYTLNLNGARFIGDLDEALAEGDSLLVISSLSGG